MKRAIFLDRDGTLNEEIGYVGDPARIRLLPGAPEAVLQTNVAGLSAVIISNQSGIARGLITEEQVRAVNQKVCDLLAAFGARVDGVYYCPHHPKGTVPAFTQECDCRKPHPGLLRQAAAELDLDLPNSFVIGDKASDMELAVAVGATPILVRTGYGNDQLEDIQHRRIPVAHVADGVQPAVEWILMKLQLSS